MSSTAELDARRVRAAKNQSLFREVNERIEQLADRSPSPSSRTACVRAARGRDVAHSAKGCLGEKRGTQRDRLGEKSVVPIKPTRGSGRAERRAANESTFREANERIEASAERLGVTTSLVPFLCECEENVSALRVEKTGEGGRLVARDDPRS
jgi:hypothetical protein